MRLFDYYYDVHSEFGEDGIIYFFVKSLNIRDKPRTFLNLSENFSRKNMFLFCIKHLNFKSSLPLTNAKVECTTEGVKEVLRHVDSVYLLCVNTIGVDYWMIDTYFRHCHSKQKPVLLFCKINAAIPFEHSVSVPYAKIEARKKNYNKHYRGSSLSALNNRLKSEYTFVGTTRNATFAVFVSKKYVVGNVSYDMYRFPNTIHANTYIWPTVSTKFWVNIANK